MFIKPQTSKEYFTHLTIFYAPLLMVPVVFGAVCYYLVSTGQFVTDAGMTSVYKIVSMVVVSAGIFGSAFISRAQFKTIKQKPLLKDKMKDYRVALLIKWALLETPAMF